jgi:hypothetical protein
LGVHVILRFVREGERPPSPFRIRECRSVAYSGALLVAGHPAQESSALYEQVSRGGKWRLTDARRRGDGFLPCCGAIAFSRAI